MAVNYRKKPMFGPDPGQDPNGLTWSPPVDPYPQGGIGNHRIDYSQFPASDPNAPPGYAGGGAGVAAPWLNQGPLGMPEQGGRGFDDILAQYPNGGPAGVPVGQPLVGLGGGPQPYGNPQSGGGPNPYGNPQPMGSPGQYGPVNMDGGGSPAGNHRIDYGSGTGSGGGPVGQGYNGGPQSYGPVNMDSGGQAGYNGHRINYGAGASGGGVGYAGGVQPPPGGQGFAGGPVGQPNGGPRPYGNPRGGPPGQQPPPLNAFGQPQQGPPVDPVQDFLRTLPPQSQDQIQMLMGQGMSFNDAYQMLLQRGMV